MVRWRMFPLLCIFSWVVIINDWNNRKCFYSRRRMEVVFFIGETLRACARCTAGEGPMIAFNGDEWVDESISVGEGWEGKPAVEACRIPNGLLSRLRPLLGGLKGEADADFVKGVREDLKCLISVVADLGLSCDVLLVWIGLDRTTLILSSRLARNSSLLLLDLMGEEERSLAVDSLWLTLSSG